MGPVRETRNNIPIISRCWRVIGDNVGSMWYVMAHHTIYFFRRSVCGERLI